MLQSIPFLSAIAVAVAYYIYTILTTTPFLQHEMVRQAVIWADPSHPVLWKLFDPISMDDALGRFRYLEYLSEALYWKVAVHPSFPKVLHDPISIFLTLGISFLLYQFCRKKNLSQFWSLALALVFLLGCPSYMVAVWHYRKAKVLASFFIMLLVLLSQERRSKLTWVLLTFLGTYTDPLFIPTIALLAWGLDFSDKKRQNQLLPWVLLGLFLGFVGVCFLNGFLGPYLNKNCQLILSHIDHKPDHFLNTIGLKFSAQVLMELLGLYPFIEQREMGICLGVIALIWLALSLRYRKGVSACAILNLPITAYTIVPSGNSTYLSYYGYLAWMLLVLGIADWVPEIKKSLHLKMASASFLVLLLFAHHVAKPEIFWQIQIAHVGSMRAHEKYLEDYKLLATIERALSKGAAYQLILDSKRMNQLYTPYDDWDGKLRHSSLGYFVIPILFQQAIAEGKLRIFKYG